MTRGDERDPLTARHHSFLHDLRMLCLGGRVEEFYTNHELCVPLEPVKVGHSCSQTTDLYKNLRAFRGTITLDRPPVNWDEQYVVGEKIRAGMPAAPLPGSRRVYSHFRVSPDGLSIDWAMTDEGLIHPAPGGNP